MVTQIKEYLELTSEEHLRNAVELTIAKTNEDIDAILSFRPKIFKHLAIYGLLEEHLAESMNILPGFDFEHTGQTKKKKDITCVSCPSVDYPDDYFSIEVKTSKASNVIGSKSYATDKPVEGSKEKDSFYIIIRNYKGTGIITTYEAFFGYIEQSEWKAAKRGGSCKIDIDQLMSEGKLIQLI